VGGSIVICQLETQIVIAKENTGINRKRYVPNQNSKILSRRLYGNYKCSTGRTEEKFPDLSLQE